MIGYFLLQALEAPENALPASWRAARRVARWSASSARPRSTPTTPRSTDPTKFVGPVYTRPRRSARPARGWRGPAARASPGDGWCPPRARGPGRAGHHPAAGSAAHSSSAPAAAASRSWPGHDGLRGVEAVVDKDLTAALLAQDLDADALLLLTDVAHVEIGYGTPDARLIAGPPPPSCGPATGRRFPAGSMGPKVEAACRFVEATGGGPSSAGSTMPRPCWKAGPERRCSKRQCRREHHE